MRLTSRNQISEAKNEISDAFKYIQPWIDGQPYFLISMTIMNIMCHPQFQSHDMFH